jgi:protein phosphatase
MTMDPERARARREGLSPVLAVDDFRPSSSRVRMELGHRSHPGTKKATNEDHYLVIRLGRHQEVMATSLPKGDLPTRFDESGYAMLVADGLGDNGSGAVASRVALSALAHLALHFGQWNVRIDPVVASEIKERAEWFYRRANDAVIVRARAHPILAGMATSLTAAYSAGDDLFIAHVGHSRAYLYRDGMLTLLTRDHTLAWQMDHIGGPAAVDPSMQDLQHILTDAVGGDADAPHIDIDHLRLLDGDMVLLCSNGLSDVLSEDCMADVLTCRRAAQEQCRLLVDLALRAGTEDNVTALLAFYEVR